MCKQLCADRKGVRNLEEIRKLKMAVFNSLERELARNPPLAPPQGGVSTCILLVNKFTALRLHPPTCSMDLISLLFFRELSTLHLKVVRNFRRSSTRLIEFPALYGELINEHN